eukprot:COSAG02_NODE_5334_length_4430_cov_2.102517_3_plen_61_part_00
MIAELTAEVIVDMWRGPGSTDVNEQSQLRQKLSVAPASSELCEQIRAFPPKIRVSSIVAQ